MTDRETRRLSFGSVATDYDRYRPSPPPEALDWLVPAAAGAVLDLAAGTGAVTRGLVGRVPRVVAVEPDERMRAVLSARCPEAEVLAGRGEDIPLPGGSVDAVLISSAWHWLDPERAVPEIARVLRPGGTLGIMWMARDSRVPWVAEFNVLARESREADRASDGPPGGSSPAGPLSGSAVPGGAVPGSPVPGGAGSDPASPEGRARPRRRQVTFPPGTPLTPPEERAIEYSLPMSKDDLAGLLGTYSGVITLDPGRREAFSRRVREYLDRQPWEQADLPMICRCLRSTRLP